MGQEQTIETLEDWKEGEFDKTSADRDNYSGELGIGYISGESEPITTSQVLDDITLQYRFNDGELASDSSGNNNDGAVNGSPSTTQGVFGVNSIFLDGENDYIDSDWTGYNNLLEQGHSISFWIKSTDDFTEALGIFGFRNSAGITWLIRSNADHGFACFIEDEDGGGDRLRARPDVSGGDIFDGEWHHIVVNINHPNSDVEWFVDGVDVGTLFEATNSSSNWSTPYSIVPFLGARNGEGSAEWFFEGNISEFMVFDKELTLSEVETLYFDGHINNNFVGSYERIHFDNGTEEPFDEFDPSGVNVPTGTQLDLIFESLDDQDDVNDSLTVTDKTDDNPVDLSGLDDGHKLRVIIDLTVNQ